MNETEKERLIELLKKDWSSLADGEEVDGFTYVAEVEGEEGRWNQTIEVITQAPSGDLYRWSYERGLTEVQESFGPGEYGTPEVVQVAPHERTVTVVDWVAVQ